MERHNLIYGKRILIGLLASIASSVITVWAIDTYAGRVSPYLIAAAAGLSTFYAMSLTLRKAIKEAYHAGEVGRRLPRSVEQRAAEHRENPRMAKSRLVDSFKTPPLIHGEYVESSSRP